MKQVDFAIKMAEVIRSLRSYISENVPPENQNDKHFQCIEALNGLIIIFDMMSDGEIKLE